MTLALEFKNTTSDYTGTGAGLAGRLTSAQVDNNSWLIKQAVEALQAASGKTISDATAVGNQMTITYTDATTDVITLPTATWIWRGEWAAGTSYAENDLFSESSALYLVLQAHTSATSFDPGETSTAGDLYQKILETGFGNPVVQEISAATYTLILTDQSTYNRCTNAGGCVITIPENASVEFPVNAEIHFVQVAATSVTFEAPTDVTLNYATDCNAATGIQYGVCTIKKVATDEWDLFGRLEVASV